MKLLVLFICLFSFVSCLDDKQHFSDENYESDPYEFQDSEIGSSDLAVVENSNSKRLKLYEIPNKQFGMLFGVMPIPNTWEAVNNKKDNIMFEAPNGTIIYGERYNRFFYSNNQQQNYYSEQNGTSVKAPKSIEQVIHEDLKPVLESNGLKLTNQFPLPELARADQQLDKALFKSVPEQKTFTCMVTEWEDQKGNKSLGVIRYFTNYYNTLGSMDWGYTVNAMEAPKSVYETSKKDYINALLSLQVNPNWLQRNNQYYAQQSQQSSIQHQQRMASIKAQGQAILNNGKTYSSILDSNHESWKRRNALTDAGQSNSVNAIWERSNMKDHAGNTYQVEGYSNNVWKNNNNEYVGTNDYNWNPNVDNATNAYGWEQLEYTDDNY